MPHYRVTETKTGIMRWEFIVEAENEEEALELVQSGTVDPIEFNTDEDPFESSSYEVEAA